MRLLLGVLYSLVSVPILFAGPLPENPLVMGSSELSAYDRAAFLYSVNSAVDLATALNYALLYEEEAEMEGVNPDLAFAQMLLETSFLRFTGQVRAGQNNYAGLGATDGGDQGLVFRSPRLGIRAQIQHLKYYATTLPLVGEVANPRLGYVKRASAPTAWQLSKTWASDPEYGKKLSALMARMVMYADQHSQRSPRVALSSVAQPSVPRN